MPLSRISFPNPTHDHIPDDEMLDIHATTVVEQDAHITIVFDFPLRSHVRRTFAGPLTSRALYKRVMDTYRDLYDEEARTTAIPVLPHHKRRWDKHRNITNGIHGIWGFDLRDIWVMGTSIQEDGSYRLNIYPPRPRT